jgi:hypothetical protein
MNAIASASMVGAQLSPRDVEDGIAHLPAERRFHDIDRSQDSRRRI